MRVLIRLGLVVLLYVVGACTDDWRMPAYRQDLCELRTNDSGVADSMILDDGSRWELLNPLSGLAADSCYRVYANFLFQEQKVEMKGLKAVVAPFPAEIDEALMQTDPLEVKAIWKSQRYLNLLVTVRTGGGTHLFAFADGGVESLPGGLVKQRLILFHDQAEDPLFYGRDGYLSCPVFVFEPELVRGRDSLEIVYNTFDGWRRKSYLF